VSPSRPWHSACRLRSRPPNGAKTIRYSALTGSIGPGPRVMCRNPRTGLSRGAQRPHPHGGREPQSGLSQTRTRMAGGRQLASPNTGTNVTRPSARGMGITSLPMPAPVHVRLCSEELPAHVLEVLDAEAAESRDDLQAAPRARVRRDGTALLGGPARGNHRGIIRQLFQLIRLV
jgi:hypothetical protein